MKKLLLLLLLCIISYLGIAQPPAQPYYTVYNFGNAFQRLAASTALIIPLQDTVLNAGDTSRGGDIVMQPGTFDVYGYNGTYWERVGCCVSSVSNNDGSLNISPNTGDVVGGINVGHTNTWTIKQTFEDTVTLGVANTTSGVLNLYNAGNANGIAIKPGTTTTPWTWTVPINAGTANYVMITDGTGVSSWGQVSATSGITGVLPPQNGGTGMQNNAASTLAILGNYPTTFTVAETTAVTLPTSGTLYGTATGSITSAQLATSLTNETGYSTGAFAVFSISPALTGTPTAPTALFGTSTTQIATTAFVTTNYTPLSTVNTQTGTTYSLEASDKGKVVEFTNNSAITLTIPSGLGSTFYCTIQQNGTGQIKVSASGTTLHAYNSYTKSAGQYAMFSIVFTGTADTYDLQGQMAN